MLETRHAETPGAIAGSRPGWTTLRDRPHALVLAFLGEGSR